MNHRTVNVAIILSTIICFSGCAGTPTARKAPHDAGTQNLVTNGDFESGSGSNPGSWQRSSWRRNNPGLVWETQAGIAGSRCVSVTSPLEDDAGWNQIVEIEPYTVYRLSGMIRGENIVPEPSASIGAGICVWDTFETTGTNTFGTFRWKEFSLDVISLGTRLNIGCRLGYFANLVKGKAYFDNIALVKSEKLSRLESRHIVLVLDKSDLAAVSPKSIDRWLTHLDDAYDAYADLVGAKPFEGKKIIILSSEVYPGGLAVAGNPIRWHRPYIRDTLKKVERHDDWTFVMLHELGHVFDLDYRWVFDAELMANLKMYYVSTVLPTVLDRDDSKFYTGTEIKKGYYREIFEAPDPGINQYMMYYMMELAEKISWEPFKKTFQFFNALPKVRLPRSNLDKFNLFLAKLSEFSKTDVKKLLPEQKLQEYIRCLEE